MGDSRNKFRRGDIVQFEYDSSDEYPLLQKGDKGTCESRNPDGTYLHVLWHRLGETYIVKADMLSRYQNPMDAPDRSKGAADTVRALSTVIDVELPHASQDVTRDLERARMQKEAVKDIHKEIDDMTRKRKLMHFTNEFHIAQCATYKEAHREARAILKDAIDTTWVPKKDEIRLARQNMQAAYDALYNSDDDEDEDEDDDI